MGKSSEHGGFVRSEVITVGALLSQGRFRPARAQREFCWTEEQVLALLEDLIAAFGEFGGDPDPMQGGDPFLDLPENDGGQDDAAIPLPDTAQDLEICAPYYLLGTMVLRPEGDHILVYDGLQRLTTLLTLCALLRDFTPDVAVRAPLAALLHTEGGAARLDLPMRHDTFSKDILAPGRTKRAYRPIPDITDAGQRLRDAVGVMRGKLAGWSAPRIAKFSEFIRARVLASVITINDRRMAGKAFVTINASGLPLKPEEMLKGQLIELAGACARSEAAETAVLRAWRALQDDLGDAFGDFIKAVDFIERRKPQTADHAIQLMDHVRRAYPAELGLKWATDRLQEYRAAYQWLDEGAAAANATGVRASLRRLSLLNWDQWKPLAMLIRMKSGRASTLQERVDALDRACFALTLQQMQPRKRAAVIARAIERLAPKGGRFGKQGGFAFDADAHRKMRQALEGPALDGPTRNVLVRWIEAARHGAKAPLYVCRTTKSSVEHVYPKNPQGNWPTFSADIDEAVTLREMIGNLCLLPEDDLKNADFASKRIAYAKCKGFLFASEIARERDWTPEHIRARTRMLADFTMKFLNFEVAVRPPAPSSS